MNNLRSKITFWSPAILMSTYTLISGPTDSIVDNILYVLFGGLVFQFGAILFYVVALVTVRTLLGEKDTNQDESYFDNPYFIAAILLVVSLYIFNDTGDIRRNQRIQDCMNDSYSEFVADDYGEIGLLHERCLDNLGDYSADYDDGYYY